MKRTSSFGITFQRGTVAGLSVQLFASTLTMQASKAADRTSVSGGLGICEGACSFSGTQKCVTFPTTEAEYVALTDFMK